MVRGHQAKGPTEPGWVYEGVGDSDTLDLSGHQRGNPA